MGKPRIIFLEIGVNKKEPASQNRPFNFYRDSICMCSIIPTSTERVNRLDPP